MQYCEVVGSFLSLVDGVLKKDYSREMKKQYRDVCVLTNLAVGLGVPLLSDRVVVDGEYGICEDNGIVRVTQEYQFMVARRYRFDFWVPEYFLAVELQGGTFSGGRHTRGAALESEYYKLNIAQLLGHKVLLVSPSSIQKGIGVKKGMLHVAVDKLVLVNTIRAAGGVSRNDMGTSIGLRSVGRIVTL